ncbi:MAG: hypothetical protein RR295_03135 [Oscillospiraceae bacterium]
MSKMPKKDVLKQHLLMAITEGKCAFEEREKQAALLIEAGKVLGPGGRPLVSESGKSAIDTAVDLLAKGKTIYLPRENNQVISWGYDKRREEPITRAMDGVYAPAVPPRVPNFFHRLSNKIWGLFGKSNAVCRQWDTYMKQKEETATYRAITGRPCVIKRQSTAEEDQAVQAARGASYDKSMKKWAVTLSEDEMMCGDSEKLDKMLLEKKLSTEEKNVLTFRMETADRIGDMGKNPVKPAPPAPKKLKDGVYLPGARQPAPQTTSNGCWSVSMQILMGYHGVELSQQEIRAYRPDCTLDSSLPIGIEEQKKERALLNMRMNNDRMNDISDFSDLIHTTMQDVALHHVSPSFETGTVELKKYIRMGLEEYNSPVSMCYKGHFRTIVGMDGDDLLLLDPQKKYPEQNGEIKPTRVPISSIKANKWGVTLDWVEKMDEKRKESAIESLRKETHEVGALISRRKGFTTNSFSEWGTSHDIVYPKSYRTEALQRNEAELKAKESDTEKQAAKTKEKETLAVEQPVAEEKKNTAVLTEKGREAIERLAQSKLTAEPTPSKPKPEPLVQTPKARAKEAGGKSI